MIASTRKVTTIRNLQTVWAFCILGPAIAAAGGYPKSQLLIEPTDLARTPDKFVILDARAAEAYSRGHLPGAIRVDADGWRGAFGDGKDSAGWSKRIAALGIDDRKPVVVYDDAAGKDAARVWWILRYWGVRDVRLLNGFYHGWKSAALPMQILQPMVRATNWKATPNPAFAADKNKVKQAAATGGQTTQIVDVRSLAEHLGDIAMNNKRPGRIPNACHLDWTDLVDVKGTQRFRSADELRRLFAKANIDLHRPIIAHCQSGGRAAVMVFAINLMGSENVANYHPSFGEWSADESLPVEKGKKT